MGIYIPDMEMPTNEPMLVKINPDGSVSTTAKNNYRKYEAIPVPKRGRLIDADRLGFAMMDAANADQALAMVDDAPTIIPAEPLKEET